jgi:tight adherence protein C
MNPTDLLPLGITIDDALAVSSAAAALLVLFAIWQGLVVRDPLADRVRALAERRASLKAGLRGARHHRARGNLRESSLGVMHRLVGRLNLLRGQHAEHYAARLARAGFRGKDALVIYICGKLAMPFLLAGVALVTAGIVHAGPLAPGLRLAVLCAGAMVGLYAPDLFVRNATDKRSHKLRKGLPDALDLLVICAEAGLSLDAAMTRVGREMAAAAPALADEFALTALELGFLPDRQQALDNLVKRTDLAELRSLINSLMQTERYGTPLAQSLRVLASEFRDERLMRAEEKAAKLPATMTVPMITFIMPALFIVLGGPAAIRIMDMFHKM